LTHRSYARLLVDEGDTLRGFVHAAITELVSDLGERHGREDADQDDDHRELDERETALCGGGQVHQALAAGRRGL
jgi:hypothetical protein